MSNGEEREPPACADLPQGWTIHRSQRHPSKPFYHHAETKVSKWTLPVKENVRYFHVDVLHNVMDNKRLGLLFELRTDDELAKQWLKIVNVMDNSVMQEWNIRCAATFPPDQLRPSDKIVQVNRKTDIGEMEQELELEGRIFMVVMRSELEWCRGHTHEHLDGIFIPLSAK